MAKQIGDIIIVGTIDDITFYEMEGKGYVRRKSSLKGTRVKKDPRFKRTMESAHRLGRGSQLASKVYRSLPREEQAYTLFKELKSLAVLAVKEGKSEAEVLVRLQLRVEKRPKVKKAGAIAVQPKRQGKAEQIKKTPRLFRVYGGRVQVGRKERPNGIRHKRWAGPADHLPIEVGMHPQRE